jgi:DNA-binding NarL/FixJ family response regulator
LLRPDVVVVDALPNGELRRSAPDAAVLLLDVSQTPQSVRDALRQGVRGYAERCYPADEIVQAIRFVGQGAAVFSPAAASRLVELAAARPRPFPELTERELEVLTLLADGAGNGETARRLGLTTKTVRNHVPRICTKLQVLDRVQAVLKAREAGLGQSFAKASSSSPP